MPIYAFLILFLTAFSASAQTSTDHEQWLNDQFSAQHQALIPIVAVADMFAACNRDKKIFPIPYQVKDLVNVMPREELAEKLAKCLGNDDIKSDAAINYGLMGCFYEQIQELPEADREQKYKLVVKAINRLSKEERQKSLTICVTDQSISYLK